MAPPDLDADQLDALAEEVADRLPPGQYGDRVVLTRRQLVAAASGTLGTAGLLSLGVDPAAAQAAGQVGTSSEPVDVFAYDLDLGNGLASALPLAGNNITNSGTTVYDAGTDTVGDGTTSADHQSVTTEQLNNTFVNAGEFNTLQDAVDFCINNSIGKVTVPPGTYDPIVLSDEIIIVGAGPLRTQIESTSGTDAVEINNSRAKISDCRLVSSSGNSVAVGASDNANNDWSVLSCRLDDGVRAGDDGFTAGKGHISLCYLNGGDITLGSDSSKNVIDSNTEVGTITDNGTNNVVGDNS